MDITYRIPASLTDDINKFAALVAEYEQGRFTAAEFKGHCSPMGVYEQRKDGTYMVRIRATGGVMYPSQLLRVIEIGRAHGSDWLHLTTRQEIQIQNLELRQVVPVLHELHRAGLASKGGGGNTVRNMLVSELSGLTADEVFDTTPYAMELTSRLLAEADSYTLPRKIKMAFSSAADSIDYAAINDVGFVAREHGGQRGFTVYVGGGAGAKPTVGWLLFDFLPATELYALARAMKNFFADHGDRTNRRKARIRFIFYKYGEDETLRLIREYYDREKGKWPPFVVEEPSDERPSCTYEAPQEAAPVPAGDYDLWRRRYVAAQRQAGYSTVLFPVFLGNIAIGGTDADRLERLLAFVERFGPHTLRFTTTQNVRLRNIPDAALPELYSILKDFDDVRTPLLINNMISCTGADTCRLGIGLPKGLAVAVRRELLQSGLDLDALSGVSVHFTGCPNSCGQQLWSDLGFAGRVLRNDRPYPGYQVFLAASRDREPRLATPVGTISAHDVPKFIARLFAAYLSVPGRGDFASYIEVEGKDEALRLLDDYREIPSYEEDSTYYVDWGAARPTA